MSRLANPKYFIPDGPVGFMSKQLVENATTNAIAKGTVVRVTSCTRSRPKVAPVSGGATTGRGFLLLLNAPLKASNDSNHVPVTAVRWGIIEVAHGQSEGTLIYINGAGSLVYTAPSGAGQANSATVVGRCGEVGYAYIDLRGITDTTETVE